MTKRKCTSKLLDSEKEFLKLFKRLTYSRSAWQVWEDLMIVMACSISNAVDRTPDKFKMREEQYERSIKNLGGVEIPAQILRVITMALEQNPDQDFLGKLYMSLNLGNHWKGQFFTPYNVCRMMAEMNFGDGLQAEIERKGYISIYDPCVGAGAMLIAAANAVKRTKVNYQTSAVFVGQDIDHIVAMMAYIQLSLMGCPGYIIIGNSILNPPKGHVLFPKDTEGREIWFTPLFMHNIWEMRRVKELLPGLFSGKQSNENRAVVRNDVVYERAKDYFHNDGKVEEEKKVKEATEQKKRQGKSTQNVESVPTETEISKILLEQKNKQESKAKKNSNIEGQIDIFSMLGM